MDSQHDNTVGLDSTFGRYEPWGTATKATLAATLPGRESLISTWRAPPAGRSTYEVRGSHVLDLKLKNDNLGPRLLPHLQAADPEGKGLVSQLELQRLLLLHFGVQLGARELDCLQAEWQVMDPFSGVVDYNTLCALATKDYITPNSTLRATAAVPEPPPYLTGAVTAGQATLRAMGAGSSGRQ